MSKDLVKLCIDTAKGKVVNYSKDQSNEAIRKAFQDIIGQEALDYKAFRRHKVEIFEILEETLDQLIVDGWGDNPFFERFVEIRNVALNDKPEFETEDRTMLNVSKFSGNHWDLRRQKLDMGEVFTVPTFWHGTKIYSDLERVISGRLDWAAFVRKVAQAFEYQIQTMVYNAFMGSQDYLPTEFTKTGVYDAYNLRSIIEHVEAASGGQTPLIIGTKTALGKIDAEIDTRWISENMKNDKNNSGILSIWEGTPALRLPQVHDKNSFDFKIANDKLLIVPSNTKPIKLVYEGEPRIAETSNGTTNMDQSVEYAFQTKLGVGVVFNTLYGMYTLE